MISLSESEITLTAIRAQGAGGQNVNKVSSAIHLRFDIPQSTLPQEVKLRLLACNDQRVTKDGVMVIKSQSHRTQEMNKMDALLRLHAWVNLYAQPPKLRKKTKPTKASEQERLKTKSERSKRKSERSKAVWD